VRYKIEGRRQARGPHEEIWEEFEKDKRVPRSRKVGRRRGGWSDMTSVHT
jgi:hypothetical protein